jgi:hypothetical protein
MKLLFYSSPAQFRNKLECFLRLLMSELTNPLGLHLQGKLITLPVRILSLERASLRGAAYNAAI